MSKIFTEGVPYTVEKFIAMPEDFGETRDPNYLDNLFSEDAEGEPEATLSGELMGYTIAELITRMATVIAYTRSWGWDAIDWLTDIADPTTYPLILGSTLNPQVLYLTADNYRNYYLRLLTSRQPYMDKRDQVYWLSEKQLEEWQEAEAVVLEGFVEWSYEGYEGSLEQQQEPDYVPAVRAWDSWVGYKELLPTLHSREPEVTPWEPDIEPVRFIPHGNIIMQGADVEDLALLEGARTGTHWKEYIPEVTDPLQKGVRPPDAVTKASEPPKPFTYDNGPAEKFSDTAGVVEYRRLRVPLVDDIMSIAQAALRPRASIAFGGESGIFRTGGGGNQGYINKPLIQGSLRRWRREGGYYNPQDIHQLTMTSLYGMHVAGQQQSIYNVVTTPTIGGGFDGEFSALWYTIEGYIRATESWDNTTYYACSMTSHTDSFVRFEAGTFTNYPSRAALRAGKVRQFWVYLILRPRMYATQYGVVMADWDKGAPVTQTGVPVLWDKDLGDDGYGLPEPLRVPVAPNTPRGVLSWNRPLTAGDRTHRGAWSAEVTGRGMISKATLWPVFQSKINPTEWDTSVVGDDFGVPMWTPEMIPAENHMVTTYKQENRSFMTEVTTYPTLTIQVAAIPVVVVEWNW